MQGFVSGASLAIGLSMAKHIFDHGPIGLKLYLSGQGSFMHQVFPI